MKNVYVMLSASARVETTTIRIKDVAQIICDSEEETKRINSLQIDEFCIRDNHKTFRKVISIMDVINKLHYYKRDLQVVNLGDSETIVEYHAVESKRPVLEVIKLILVCGLVFFGAAFTIMAFNNDISISGVFEQVYMQMTGHKKPEVSELEVAYTIGLFLGITVFFNHIGNTKITNDVTPIEVELNKHITDRYKTIIDVSKKEKEK